MIHALGKIEQPHWASLDRAALRTEIRAGRLTPDHINVLDVYLHKSGDTRYQGAHRAVFEAVAADYGDGWGALSRLKAALLKLTQDRTVIRELEHVMQRLRQARKPAPRPPKQRTRHFSVYPEELPQSWQEALARANADQPGADDRIITPSMRQSIQTKLCECAKVARDRALEPAFTIELMFAYEASLHRRARPLTPTTITSAMTRLRDFARYIGADTAVIAHLNERVRFNERRTTKSTPVKEERVSRLPSLRGTFAIAFDLLGRADLDMNPRHAHRKRNGALAITLLSAIPLRLADAQLTFGKDLLWTGEQYRLNVVSSKTFVPIRAPILGPFQYFIDKVVLAGYGPECLEERRQHCLDTRRPLFVNHDGTTPHAGYTSYLWRRELGTGHHAARTRLHDEFAELGAMGVQMAMQACGQRSERTAEFYRSEAFDFCATRRVQDTLTQLIPDEEWKRYCADLQALNEPD